MNKALFTLLVLSISIFADTITTQNAVVKVFASISLPDYKYPYQTSKISTFTGSGAIISNNKILTSAHVVSGARFIEIQKEDDPNKYVATVKYISHQADLAILELKDKSFFNGTNPLKLSEDIKTRDEVTVFGYPLGGNTISTTTGVVSRIEYRSYVWSGSYLLAIQIDAAINSGNSGGAVVNAKNELVGIAMMKLQKTSNIGYIVPSVVINTFLEDVEDGVVNGFHSDSVIVQNINNNSQKKLYGLADRRGVLITYVGIDEQLLKVDDILLEVDDKDIANNGTVKTKYGRVNFSMPFHTKQLSQSVKLKVLRDKKELTIKYPLKKVIPLINKEFGKEPRYIIYGGFVFTPLTKNYLNSIYSSSNGLNMLFYQKNKTVDYQEPVVSLRTIFPSEVNRGYYSASYVLVKVNDIKIKNFNHLVDVLDNMTDEYTVFKFLEKTKVVLNTKDAKNSLDAIMKLYYLKSNRRI
jgi:S1-C subfamily serine protease